jgi:hypothetical protein
MTRADPFSLKGGDHELAKGVAVVHVVASNIEGADNTGTKKNCLQQYRVNGCCLRASPYLT